MQKLEELISLQEESGKEVVTGMQRRYAPACRMLKAKLKEPQHYIYRYGTGAYQEGGDVLRELFIHPIDLVIYLFGAARIVSLLHTDSTILLQMYHTNGVIGSVELSTGYSWQLAEEQLTVIEKNGIYELRNLSELIYRKNPPVIGGIPLEKVLGHRPVTEVLFNQNMFQPVLQHNNLYINGFYTELETFSPGLRNGEKEKKLHGIIRIKTYLQITGGDREANIE
ncbi:MAG: hypothetical protein LUE93_07910 [Bacteroides sp.]|nr:hypothetical protein [Bacteroides sp.]